MHGSFQGVGWSTLAFTGAKMRKSFQLVLIQIRKTIVSERLLPEQEMFLGLFPMRWGISQDIASMSVSTAGAIIGL